MNEGKQLDIHETQAVREIQEEPQYVDEQLLPMQRIEGGGPIKRVPLHTMPAPLRIFGYLFLGFMALMGVMALVVTFFR
jgi:hypothetical protein